MYNSPHSRGHGMPCPYRSSIYSRWIKLTIYKVAHVGHLVKEFAMAKMHLTLPDEMQQALQKASEDEDRVIASIIRRAIAEYLVKHHNVKVEHTMTWGGNRRGAEGDKEE